MRKKNWDIGATVFTSQLNSHVLKKIKVVRRNHKPHLNEKNFGKQSWKGQG